MTAHNPEIVAQARTLWQYEFSMSRAYSDGALGFPRRDGENLTVGPRIPENIGLPNRFLADPPSEQIEIELRPD